METPLKKVSVKVRSLLNDGHSGMKKMKKKELKLKKGMGLVKYKAKNVQ